MHVKHVLKQLKMYKWDLYLKISVCVLSFYVFNHTAAC